MFAQQPAQAAAFQQQPAQAAAFQQQPAQAAAFQQQQPAMQQNSPFGQPFAQPQGQAMFPNQSAQMFNAPAGQSMFGAAPQQQQQMFQQPQQQVRFQQPPAQAAASPFAQPAAQPPAQPAQFSNDPFATNGFPQANTQAAAPAQGSNNPFASTGNQAFGVLQPQQAAQPSAAPFGQPQAQQSSNLFSDLNPLPPGSQQMGKDQFFSDVKNPPKPKLNEMQPQTTQQPDPAANSK